MNDTGYLIWFIATIVMTVSVMALGVAASSGAFRRPKSPAQTSGRPHLRLVPHHRDAHDRHHAA